MQVGTVTELFLGRETRMPSPGPFVCVLCGRSVRSVYSLPGDKAVRLCSKCFFKPVPTSGPEVERG